jgi:hypothetical protein
MCGWEEKTTWVQLEWDRFTKAWDISLFHSVNLKQLNKIYYSLSTIMVLSDVIITI